MFYSYSTIARCMIDSVISAAAHTVPLLATPGASMFLSTWRLLLGLQALSCRPLKISCLKSINGCVRMLPSH